jgi:thiol-disulfide isomerase/thioredoxin
MLGAAVVAAAATAGFFGYRFFSQTDGATTASTAAPAPPPPAAATPRRERAIPERLPDITMADRDGKPRRLTDWADRPLLINFWATWCAPCRREIPLLKRLRAERQSQRLEVIGIAVDFRDAVLDYAREIGLDYPLLIGEDDGLAAAAAFGMDMVLPFSIFSDRQGRIVTMKVGELHADEAAFILDTVREIDAGAVELPVARQRIAAHLKQLATARATGTLDPISAEAREK